MVVSKYTFNVRGELTEVSVFRVAKAEKIRLESFKLTFKDHLAFPRHTGTNRNPVPIHSTTRATALKVNVDISIFVVRI